MRLADIAIETREVPFGDKPEETFPVRGLNLADLMQLGISHTPAMKALFEKGMRVVQESKEDFTPEDLKKLLFSALKDAPDLVFKGIAMAADEPESWEKVKRLPMTAQLIALEEIFALSLKTDAELKKLQEVIFRLIEKAATFAEKLNAKGLLTGGSGVSGRG
jgi:hypothetical protein